MADTKVCSKCKRELPATAEYFHRDKYQGDGLCPSCKCCVMARKNAHYAENRSVYLERIRTYDEAHKQDKAEYNRAYYRENRDAIAEYSHAYHEKTRSARREYFRNWRKANPDYERVRRVRDPLLTRIKNHRRLAFKRSAEGTHTAADIRKQYKAQSGKCYYCNAEVGDTYHVDHVVPLSRGGSNGPENLVISCPHCNVSKGAKLPSEWIEGGRLI